MPRRIRSAWILPVDRPPLGNGVVVIDQGCIVDVGPADRLGFAEDWGDVVILPGLVNAHVHLDLTHLRGRLPRPESATGWLKQVMAHRQTTTVEETLQAIAAGAAECLRHGTTCVGDIDGQGLTRQVLAQTPLRGVVYHELLGLAPSRIEKARQATNHLPREPEPSLRAGLSPHAPYSVAFELLAWSVRQNLPLAMHLGEFAEEADLLERRTGPFREFLEGLGLWLPEQLAPSWDAILAELSRQSPWLVAHGNHLPPRLWPKLAGGSVIYCPRTHAAFGHPPHPAGRMLAAGVNVALGTDSLASNPDLSLLAEMRFLWQGNGEFDGPTLLRMGTLSGAEALGLSSMVGSLTPGKRADLLALRLPTNARADVHRLLLEGREMPHRLMIGGQEIEITKPGC